MKLKQESKFHALSWNQFKAYHYPWTAGPLYPPGNSPSRFIILWQKRAVSISLHYWNCTTNSFPAVKINILPYIYESIVITTTFIILEKACVSSGVVYFPRRFLGKDERNNCRAYCSLYCQFERERVRSLRQNAFPRKRAVRRRREQRNRVKTHVWMLKSGRGWWHVIHTPRASFYYDLFMFN